MNKKDDHRKDIISDHFTVYIETNEKVVNLYQFNDF